jgi:sulfite oxidase
MVDKVSFTECEDLPSTSRRGFLRVAGVTALGGVIGYSMPLEGVAGNRLVSEAFAAGDKPLPEYVKWKDAASMIVHSDNTVETKRGAIGSSIITPEDRLYIRNNVNPPDESIVADRDAWKVEIAGVKQPKTLTVGELKTMGIATVAMVLQCSGNGRAFHKAKLEGTDKKISGTSWTTGAAGCLIWSGVPLKNVVEALGGAVDGMKFVTGTGGETIPEGVNAKDVLVERSVPIDVLDNIILAWELNGKPITLGHGGPLRMIVPGYTGVNSVKYVKTVALTEKQSDAKIQQTHYRMYPIDRKGTPQDPSVWAMEVKSWITSPLESAKGGKVYITGVAFGGMNAVKGVEVSVDGGKSWQNAEFVGPDLGRFAWRQFQVEANLKPGNYKLVSRATDTEGKVQPEDVEVNGAGYLHNGWMAHGVDVTVS